MVIWVGILTNGHKRAEPRAAEEQRQGKEYLEACHSLFFTLKAVTDATHIQSRMIMLSRDQNSQKREEQKIKIIKKKNPKTYNSRYSLVVTHPTTNLPI
jgi:hypothetical protein